MLAIITGQGMPSPFRTTEASVLSPETEMKNEIMQDLDVTDDPLKETSKLIIMQFTIQHLALEVC